MPKPPKASVIIPTFKRPLSLQECLESLDAQTYRDFEVILVEEEGELARLRNVGARRARGDYLIFTDDDVRYTPDWLARIVQVFGEKQSVAGVSGPSIIKREFKESRDIFRYKLFKRLYDLIFCEGKYYLPGHITKAGAWTTGACEETCSYSGEVMFLEACNMAFRKEAFWEVGGFDEAFKGVGDWSEPDLAYRIRANGHKLWFNPLVKLYHFPSKTGAYKKRETDGRNRMENYLLFSKRWVKPCLRHTLYKWFMRTYYAVASH